MLVRPLIAAGHDALATRQAGNHGLADPRQLLFARHHGRIMVTFNDVDYAMLHETLVLWAARGTQSGTPLHAGIALLPSSSRVAPDQLVAALDQLPRFAADFANRCFRWIPATGWEDVVVPSFALS
jgi:hypothetical protein